MAIWHTWLGFIGLVSGLVLAALFGWSAMRSALVGLAGGLALVAVVNVADSNPAACLQESKRWQILWTYSLKCPDPNKDLLPAR